MSKTKTPTTITAPAIFRICDKLSHKCIGYGVPSDSQPGTTYFVTWNYSRHEYECNGAKCGYNKPCKHIRAVETVCQAKKELAAPRRLAAFFAALATVAQQIASEQAVAEVEQAVQPPQRYCDACSCALPLQEVDGLLLCATCAEQTHPAIIEPPPHVAPPTMATKRQTAPLGSNEAFSLMR